MCNNLIIFCNSFSSVLARKQMAGAVHNVYIGEMLRLRHVYTHRPHYVDRVTAIIR